MYFGLLHLISFEFEDILYPSERNAWVTRYTKYIIDIPQDILVLLKDVGFNRRPVPYVRECLSRQELNLIQNLGQMRTKRCTDRLKAIK